MANRSGKQGKYSDLYQTLQVLPMHGARRTLLVLLMIALVKATTVNTKELATAMETGVTLEANVRRIERFLAALVLKSDYVARLLMALLPFEGRYRLSLDRTNWKSGSKKINVLVLAVVYEGMAISILWSFLAGKKGNSNQAERIALLERFIDLSGTAQIEWLSADREFIGREWWAICKLRVLSFTSAFAIICTSSAKAKSSCTPAICSSVWSSGRLGLSQSGHHRRGGGLFDGKKDTHPTRPLGVAHRRFQPSSPRCL